jgi:hypothetical protein
MSGRHPTPLIQYTPLIQHLRTLLLALPLLVSLPKTLLARDGEVGATSRGSSQITVVVQRALIPSSGLTVKSIKDIPARASLSYSHLTSESGVSPTQSKPRYMATATSSTSRQSTSSYSHPQCIWSNDPGTEYHIFVPLQSGNGKRIAARKTADVFRTRKCNPIDITSYVRGKNDKNVVLFSPAT